MLSNASIDVAFHDKNYFKVNFYLSYLFIIFTYIVFFTEISSLNKSIRNKVLKRDLYDNEIEYVSKFFVGLFDAKGSIQVNHWKYTNLEYRLVIKLDNFNHNKYMLLLISKIIGGIVRVDKNKKYIIWTMTNEKDIIYLINTLFKKYPLLTKWKQYQLAFLLLCHKNNNISFYLKNRNNKYNNNLYKNNISIQNIFICINNDYLPFYFNEWLSGFIEGNGNFNIKYISQYNLSNNEINYTFTLNYKDKQLIDFISKYFGSNIRPKLIQNTYYIEIYKKEVLFNIINHLYKYNLLGYNNFKFINWSNSIKNK